MTCFPLSVNGEVFSTFPTQVRSDVDKKGPYIDLFFDRQTLLKQINRTAMPSVFDFSLAEVPDYDAVLMITKYDPPGSEDGRVMITFRAVPRVTVSSILKGPWKAFIDCPWPISEDEYIEREDERPIRYFKD